MSTAAKKPVQTTRDIYEATDQEYNTVNYRNKLCDYWISYQQNQEASLHELTDLESNAPNTTQRSRPAPTSSKRQYSKMDKTANEQQMKKRKHNRIDVSNFDGFQTTPQIDMGNLDEPFFEYEQNRAVKQSQAKRMYDSGMGGGSGMSTSKHHFHRHHQSQSHPNDMPPSRKRQKLSDQYFDDNNPVDFQCDFDLYDAGPTEKIQQQQQKQLEQNAKKKNENGHRLHSRPANFDKNPTKKDEHHRLYHKNIDKGFTNDSFAGDFDFLANAFDDRDKIHEQSTPQFIYKHVKERSYSELLGTTPTWQKEGNGSHEKKAAQWKNNDDFLFKQPALVAADQNVSEKFNWHDERDGRRYRHRDQQMNKRQSNQQYMISHEVEKFVPKSNEANKQLYVLKTGPSHTTSTSTSTSTQPQHFYIKCNNLLIKHD